jgi:hypothetical protein
VGPWAGRNPQAGHDERGLSACRSAALAGWCVSDGTEHAADGDVRLGTEHRAWGERWAPSAGHQLCRSLAQVYAEVPAMRGHAGVGQHRLRCRR